jgi:uncharacterized protein (TIGR03083 family)
VDDLYCDRLTAIEQTWQTWAEVGAGLSEEQWSAPSRCAGWDVAALFAHHSVFPVVISGPLPDSAQHGPAPLTAAQILTGYNEPGGIAHEKAGEVADRATAQAAQLSHAELVDRFQISGPAAVAALRATEPDRIIGWPPVPLPTTLLEATRLVLMEATVHLLDVLRALDQPPGVPERALTETAALLGELAPPVAFIEAASGRVTESPLPVLR